MSAQPDLTECLRELEGRLHDLEQQVGRSRRQRPGLWRGVVFTAIAFLVMGAVTVTSADLEVHENPDGGGAGSDSYALRLIGRISGPTDAAMQLQNIANTDTTYRLAVLEDDAGGANELLSIENGGDVGIGTTDPAARLHVTGTLALTTDSVTLTDGTNNNLSIPDAAVITMDGISADRDLTGVAGGFDGRVVFLVSADTFSVKIQHEDSGSSAANRIRTPSGGVLTVNEGGGVMLIYYDGGISRWRTVTPG